MLKRVKFYTTDGSAESIKEIEDDICSRWVTLRYPESISMVQLDKKSVLISALFRSKHDKFAD